ncbi:MAG: T6SS effector amidase Tae4 family protein [Pirellulales bacterium]
MVARPSFNSMYLKYQEFRGDPHPISGVSSQCAVRMSMSLSVVGLYSYKRFKSVVPDGATKEGWSIRAEELYQYLRHSSVLGPADLVPPSELWNKYGIVYLRNCWMRDGESEKGRSGDHFDLLYPQADGRPTILSARFYPADVSNSIIDFCRDGKARFWECPSGMAGF